MTNQEKIEELKKQAEKIKESADKVYGDCTDGSYEVALSYNGYWELQKQIKELENQKEE